MTDSELTQAKRHLSSHQRLVLWERAWRMRHEPTRAEWLLWQALKRHQLGVTFRRQVVLQGFIADFYASQRKLIVEVDGESHTSHRADARRDRVLNRAGYRVLRVSSEDVVTALPTVLAKIRTAL
jgi:very-short-patch-repair endonuclease